MKCARCGHRLLSGADFDRERVFEQRCYYAVDADGDILLGGKCCLPDCHLVRYEPEDIQAAAREIARLL